MKIKDFTFLTEKYNLICVTGKMASGKNFICTKLEQFGWFSADADLLVHKAIDDCSQVIIQTFSEDAKAKHIELLTKAGKIDRRELGKLLFDSPDLLKKQEEIIYPVITKMIQDIIQNHKKVILNATVLYKTPEILNMCEAVIFVKSNFIKRFFRAKKRDRLSTRQILKRFKSQKNLYKKYKNSNIPIFLLKN